MSVSGLTGSPWKCCLRVPIRGLGPFLCRRASAFRGAGKLKGKMHALCLERSYRPGYVRRCNTKQIRMVKCAMDASFGGVFADDQSEASEEEIQAARNFLIQKYAGHKPSVDAIETAHDRIIMQKFYERKNPKIDIKKKVREVKQSRVVQTVASRFQTPSTLVIVKTAMIFLVLGALTIFFPTEEGPTLQVAISLIATLYFIYDRLKSKIRAALYGVGAFIFSWLIGTFLMVSVVPPLAFVKGMRSFEVTTSLITYLLLWVSSTYLK